LADGLVAMFERIMREKLVQFAQQFPCVFLTGPRQSGKTTLLKATFPEYHYISLENPNVLSAVQYDPIGFFKDHTANWIIDEAQEYTDLFKFLQGFIDENPKVGRFILSGSQNFLLSEKISQSLAGRAGVLELLPLTYQEYLSANNSMDIWYYLFNGQYPKPLAQNLGHADWIASYVRTYVERDVRTILGVQNLSKFQTFLRLCAARHGQLLNLNSLAIDAGISQTTATKWISVLEASYLCFRLTPYFNNYKKRLVKMPKLYFFDSGLVCFLLGLEFAEQVALHPMRGAIFEGFIIAEMLKKRFSLGKASNMYFWRDHQGLEIDVVEDKADQLICYEIKSSATFRSEFLDNLKKFTKLDANAYQTLIYCGQESFTQGSVQVKSWDDFCLNG
jgi:predicted AAA+ superfamily ATPase